jgi:hypothetical protein
VDAVREQCGAVLLAASLLIVLVALVRSPSSERAPSGAPRSSDPATPSSAPRA